MRRIVKLFAGLLLAGTMAAGLPARGADQVKSRGTGPAYELVGKVAVMHEGRVKPLDTVAREEVKQVYGRETIKLQNPREEIAKILDPMASGGKDGDWPVESWGHVSAFIGWTTLPEFWDEQPFILVDYLPLRRRILADTVKTGLEAIAGKSTTPDVEKARLQQLAGEPEPTSAALTALVRGSKLPIEDRNTIAELAGKLSEEHKWLTPRELDEARLTVNGQPTSFLDWAAELQTQQRRYNENPKSAARPLPIEKRAVEVAMRLWTYKAYSGERIQTAGLVLIMPRPSNANYLADSSRAIKEAREKGNARDLPLFKLDELNAISSYWQNIPRDDRHDPTENAKFDENFTAWLRDNSVWVPLKVILKSKPEELIAAGYPQSQLQAFLDAYHELEQAESASPGSLSLPMAQRFLTASRELGEAVNPTKYPTVGMIEREANFNAMNPFWQAPMAYGAAVALLVLSLAFAPLAVRSSLPALLRSSTYGLGLAALLTGIALEIYGFYFRVRITGWAPVTNMYETVIWVALVAAVLSFIFEMIYRKTYTALAGSAVALLGTITAANVPLLDPSIKSLQPVLRSNLWLTIHVLTEVSSYAAFGLTWMLGLIATLYYLAATYRRSPRFSELALPLVPGLPLLALGAAGVAASYGMFGPQWSIGDLSTYSSSQPVLGGDTLFYLLAIMGLLGGVLSLVAILAMGGELLERASFRDGNGEDEAQNASTSSGLKLDARGRSMQQTAAVVKPLSNFIYRTMQVGVLLIAAGTILGGVWADYSWGRFWGWDPKEVWALITLLVYLIPLHGRFAGWVSSFGLVVSSVLCFLSVVMAWYGVNFVLGVGLHSYGFVEGGSQGSMAVIIAAVMAFPFAAAWRRFLGQHRPSSA
jgi:ABC-type transport system involved in cytochrome c biogenesis permease subunit